MTGHAAALAGLFASSFLSATILPGNSELVLGALIASAPALLWPAIGVATVGNTLGGMTTYWMARLIPAHGLPTNLDWVRRYGSASLILAWTPLVGDALCAAAGWLRLNWLACAIWMALGKFVRYALVVSIT